MNKERIAIVVEGDDEAVDVVSKMLKTFDNETENGLLYINYPMVEALRDYIDDECMTPTGCYISINDIKNYKNQSAANSNHVNINQYSVTEWAQIIDAFVRRASCLGKREDVFTYDLYKQTITPDVIYTYQNEWVKKDKVFVLSAFPEFLLDYNKMAFWHTMVKHKKNSREKCEYIKIFE